MDDDEIDFSELECDLDEIVEDSEDDRDNEVFESMLAITNLIECSSGKPDPEDMDSLLIIDWDIEYLDDDLDKQQGQYHVW